MFIVYANDNEVLVTTHDLEAQMLKQWFFEGSGRLQEDYDREVHADTAVFITSSMRLS